MTDPLMESEDDIATPLTPEEREALIPSYITLRRELNEVEQIGIADADRWAFSRKRDVLDDAFLKRLHHRMFKECGGGPANFAPRLEISVSRPGGSSRMSAS